MTKNNIFLAAVAGAEAMREAAAKIAAGDTDVLRRQGHVATASANEFSAQRIRSIQAEDVIGNAPVSTPGELDAFGAAAKAAKFNTQRQDDEKFVHYLTERAWAIWRAGVRWAQSAAEECPNAVKISAMDRAGEVSEAMSTNNKDAVAELKRLAEAATPQNFDSAEDASNDGWIECPHCNGEGTVELTADYCNYDGLPLGVQFYGIGDENGAAEAYYRAANPAAILDLIAAHAAQAERIAALEKGLQFYANGDHFTLHDPNAWDTVSGEPANFYEDESNTATVEDGSIAKMVLGGTPIPDDDEVGQPVQQPGDVHDAVGMSAIWIEAAKDPAFLADLEQGSAEVNSVLGAAAPAPAQQSKPTDISERLREYAGNPGYSHGDYADTMRQAADEIERYYGAMLAWKQTAEKKDRDWQEAVTKATDERCAARAAASAVPAPPAGQSEDIKRLESEIARLKRVAFIMSQCVHNLVVGNQAAWIEWQHGGGAEVAMTWIHNGLAGPGHVPRDGGDNAQAYFDANVDDRMEPDAATPSPQGAENNEGVKT